MQSRREFLKFTGLLMPALAVPGLAFAKFPVFRRLRFEHTHTQEKLDVVYYEAGKYLDDALDEINHLLRDFRTREVTSIDPGLLDCLADLQQHTGTSGRYQIISGYRSPATNENLRHSTGGVAENSLHMQGRAIDVRLTDLTTKQLNQAAVELRRGGVGHYARSDFVHLDTGKFRTW